MVGSGVAGCAAALIAAERHKIPVRLLFAGSVPTDCNSYWAQGGIIYRNYDPEAKDSIDALVADVHRAGAGLCVEEAVRKLAIDGPHRVRELLLNRNETSSSTSTSSPFADVPFDRTADGELSYCLEASHSAPRIIHKADHTGRAITEHITAAAASHPLITIVPNTIVTDLVVGNAGGEPICVGVQAMNKRPQKRQRGRQNGDRQSEDVPDTVEQKVMLTNRGVVLASGGLGGIFQHSTNPSSGFNALGSSIALATRVGVQTQDLEYVQFHPTSLYIPGESRFLLTEALRGEGAVLRDSTGRPFAKDYHEDGELAPRDVVARAVFSESQKSPSSADGEMSHNAFLDISHRDADWLRQRFPSIDAHLLARGLDFTKDPMPVVPAAHYTCGGVSTDLMGRTSMRGLYAAGEAARTGLHGGNRLASTSLLEGLVFGASVADCVALSDYGAETREAAMEAVCNGGIALAEDRDPRHLLRSWEDVADHHQHIEAAKELLARLRRVMWDGVGVVRTPAGMAQAKEQLCGIGSDARVLFGICPTPETAGLRDAVVAGLAVAEAASANLQSRGGHCVILAEEKEKRGRSSFVFDNEQSFGKTASLGSGSAQETSVSVLV